MNEQLTSLEKSILARAKNGLYLDTKDYTFGYWAEVIESGDFSHILPVGFDGWSSINWVYYSPNNRQFYTEMSISAVLLVSAVAMVHVFPEQYDQDYLISMLLDYVSKFLT